MDLADGWAVVAYIGFSMVALFVFLVAVGGFLLDEDESLFERTKNSHELFVWRVMTLLGVFRTAIWIVIAAVWPVFLVVLIALYFIGKYCLVCRPTLVRTVRWFFLGFGKFSGKWRTPSWICGND